MKPNYKRVIKMQIFCILLWMLLVLLIPKITIPEVVTSVLAFYVFGIIPPVERSEE
jgi:hypothetical protein